MVVVIRGGRIGQTVDEPAIVQDLRRPFRVLVTCSIVFRLVLVVLAVVGLDDRRRRSQQRICGCQRRRGVTRVTSGIGRCGFRGQAKWERAARRGDDRRGRLPVLGTVGVELPL